MTRLGSLELKNAISKTHGVADPSSDVRLADQLDHIEAMIRQHLELSHPDFGMLVALWIANTYTFECFDYCGYLHIQSATPQCGKTTLLKVLRYLSKGKPPILTAPTAAVLFRSKHNVLLIDEAERLRNHDKENFGTLITVLNAGIEKEGQVERLRNLQNGNFDPETFAVYRPKALAGIEEIADTLESRSFHIRMQRAATRLKRLRGRMFERDAQPVRERLKQWAREKEAMLRELYDTLVEHPDGLDLLKDYDDRFQDLAEPLVLLATLADEERPDGPLILPRLKGGLEAAWKRRAPLDRESRFNTFLGEAKSRLGNANTVFVTTDEILRRCQEIPALAPITSVTALANLLKPFDLSPRSTGTVRGYDLTRAWVDTWSARYARQGGQD